MCTGSKIRIMIIGESGSGRSTMIHELTGKEYRPRKALAPVYFGNFVETPGEFLENRRFYRALITTSMGCDVLFFVQDATKRTCQMPPGFAAMFNRRVIGIVSKCDATEANVPRAERFLRNAGARQIWHTALKSPGGVEDFRLKVKKLCPAAGQE